MEKIIDGSICALTSVAFALICLGRAFTNERQRNWGGFLALLGFVLFGAYRLHVNPPRTADELFERITMRALMLFFILLGASWVLLPLVCAFWEGLWRALEQSVRVLPDLPPVRHDVVSEQKDDLDDERAAQTLLKEHEQKQKADLRSKIEILFQIHAHVISSRLDKQTVMDWIARYMNDDQPLDAVQGRAKEMETLILSIVKDLEVPEKTGPLPEVVAARAEIAAMYQRHPEIHAVCPSSFFQADLNVRIPDNATPEAAWQAARQMIEEILGLADREKQKQPKPLPVNPPLENI